MKFFQKKIIFWLIEFGLDFCATVDSNVLTVFTITDRFFSIWAHGCVCKPDQKGGFLFHFKKSCLNEFLFEKAYASASFHYTWASYFQATPFQKSLTRPHSALIAIDETEHQACALDCRRWPRWPVNVPMSARSRGGWSFVTERDSGFVELLKEINFKKLFLFWGRAFLGC